MCRVEGAEIPQVYHEETRKARKEHRCAECGRTIAVTETYRSHFYVQDGIANMSKTCAHCCVAADWLVTNCGGYIFEEVIEEIKEHADEYPMLAMPLLRLVVGARRKWITRDDRPMPLPPAPPDISVSETNFRDKVHDR